jgi:hypothetical protein
MVNLTVTYDITKPEARLQSFDLVITATEAEDMSSAVFVMHRGVHPVLLPGTGPSDVFQCVADPVDLEEMPLDEPDIENNMPYYRVSSVTLRFRSIDEMMDVRADIDDDIAGLVRSLRRAATMDSSQVVY